MHRRRVTAGALLVAVVSLLGLTVGRASATDDPFFAQQWGLTQIGAPTAWATSTGQGVLIGVVDTGIDLTHEDLAAKIVASTSCIGSHGDSNACSGTAQDDNGHGTHVAGIAAAITGNGKGVAGVAPDAKLLVARAMADDQNGDPTAPSDTGASGSVDDVNAGIAWVVDHGARVVNLSLGDPRFVFTTVFGTPLSSGIEYAWTHGAVVVLAAGNANTLGLGSSNYGNLDALVVGATDRSGNVASYSSPLGNAKWGLVAPGGAGGSATDPDFVAKNIISTWWDRKHPDATDSYAADAGTSMAAPQVTGAVALLLAQGLSPAAAVQRVLDTADGPSTCGTGCHGRLDVARAVAASAPATTTSVVPSPTTPPTTRVAGQAAAAPVTSSPAPAGVAASGTATRPTSAPGPSTTTRTAPNGRASAAGPTASNRPSDGSPVSALARNLEAHHARAQRTWLVLALGLVAVAAAAVGVLGWRRVRGGAGR